MGKTNFRRMMMLRDHDKNVALLAEGVDRNKTRNAEIFAALPVAVQRWAGSPAELSMTFGRDGADLLQFVKPGFVRAVSEAPIESLQPPALPGGAAPAQIGGGTA